MKNILYILILTIFGCNNQTKKTDDAIQVDTTKQISTIKKIDNSKYYTTKDTLLLVLQPGETLSFGKAEFNQIVDNHPELFSEYPQEPDISYYCNADKGDFESQVGQDGYYVLYAYLLKQKNGTDKYAERRERLIDIYLEINCIFSYLQNGGSYFGHQIRRIFGYAEYSVYVYSESKDNIESTYNIKKQKELYLKSLRQLINDEIRNSNETIGAQNKTDRINEINEIVDKLDRLITDIFYLRMAQEFQYSHYLYY